MPSKRFVGRGCQTRPALACHTYAGSLRINTTIFRNRAASPLAALLPYYTLKIRSIPSPVRRTGLGRQIYIENRQFSVSKVCRSYFLFTPHGLGDFLDSLSLFHCSSSVSLLLISQEAKPHCGLRQRRSSGIYFSASWMRAITASLSSRRGDLVVTRPSTTFLPSATYFRGSKLRERAAAWELSDREKAIIQQLG